MTGPHGSIPVTVPATEIQERHLRSAISNVHYQRKSETNPRGQLSGRKKKT
jgi:hypothetical protein